MLRDTKNKKTNKTNTDITRDQPRDGEAWWAAVYGVAQNRT